MKKLTILLTAFTFFGCAATLPVTLPMKMISSLPRQRIRQAHVGDKMPTPKKPKEGLIKEYRTPTDLERIFIDKKLNQEIREIYLVCNSRAKEKPFAILVRDIEEDENYEKNLQNLKKVYKIYIDNKDKYTNSKQDGIIDLKTSSELGNLMLKLPQCP